MQKGDHVEHQRASKQRQKKGQASAGGAYRAKQRRVEGSALMKLLEKALAQGRGGDEGLLRRRRELPVFSLRCGKRRLPADSIRASSGGCIKGIRARKGKAQGGGGGNTPRWKDKGGMAGFRGESEVPPATSFARIVSGTGDK